MTYSISVFDNFPTIKLKYLTKKTMYGLPYGQIFITVYMRSYMRYVTVFNTMEKASILYL